MPARKRRIRQAFQHAVLSRDGWMCLKCGNRLGVVAHHITDRKEMENGGHVPENGISLCDGCHRKAEALHETGTALSGFSPDELYGLIGSSEAAARKADGEWQD